MITAEELVKSTTIKEPESNFKMALVVELFENDTAKLQFDGEEVPSEKQYAYLDWYIPQINDRVMLGKIGGTYVVLGKVNYDVGPSTEEEIDRYLFDLKKVIMMKGLSVSGDSDFGKVTATHLNVDTSSLGEANAGSLDVSGNINGDNISGNSLDVSGSINGNSIKATDKVTTRTIITSGEGSIGGTFAHKGSMIGVFGKTPATKTILYPFTNQSTFTLNDAYDGINNIVNAMRRYGFF